MKEIMLQNTAQGLMAHFLENGKPEAAIVSVMGTHIIPTPYISADTMEEAMKAIKKLNPGYKVTFFNPFACAPPDSI